MTERTRTDEVKALAAWGTHVSDDEVDAIVGATEHRVQGARPDLSVGGELVGFLSVGREYFVRYTDADRRHSRRRC